MGFSKGNEEKNIVITDSEKKKLDRDKANAIQEKKRVEVETSQLKIEQEKVKESLKNELDAVKDSIKMFKKEEEAQKVKVNIVALEVKDAKNSLKAIKEDVSKELQDSYKNLDEAYNKNNALVKSFENKINKLKKQEVVLVKNIEWLKGQIEKFKLELTFNKRKEGENVKLLKENENKVDVLAKSIKTLEDAETRLVNSLASKSIVLRETESSIDAINDKLSKVDADLLTKHDELKKVSENLDQSNAQIIANQKRSSYLADWANQLEIEKKANSNTNKKLRKREKALREANA